MVVCVVVGMTQVPGAADGECSASVRSSSAGKTVCALQCIGKSRNGSLHALITLLLSLALVTLLPSLAETSLVAKHLCTGVPSHIVPLVCMHALSLLCVIVIISSLLSASVGHHICYFLEYHHIDNVMIVSCTLSPV